MRRMRIYWQLRGGHVHCRMFTVGKNGDLAFSVAEWPWIKEQFEKFADVKEE